MAPGLLAVVLAGGAGPQASGGAAISWQAPPQCPSAVEVVAMVERFLGRPIGDQGDSFISAVASVEHQEPGLRLVLEIRSMSGTSVSITQDERCEVLAKLVALKVAIAIDPRAVLAATEPRPPPPAVEVETGNDAPRERPLVVEPVEPEPAPRPRLRAGLAVRVSAAVRWPLAELGPGVLGTVAIRWRAWRAELGGSYWTPRQLSNAVVSAYGGHAGGCWTPRVHRRLEVPVCGQLEVGAVDARGTGLEVNRRVRKPWVAVLGGPSLAWVPHRSIAVWLGASLSVWLSRPALATDDQGEFNRAPSAGVMTHGGVEFRWGH